MEDCSTEEFTARAICNPSIISCAVDQSRNDGFVLYKNNEECADFCVSDNSLYNLAQISSEILSYEEMFQEDVSAEFSTIDFTPLSAPEEIVDVDIVPLSKDSPQKDALLGVATNAKKSTDQSLHHSYSRAKKKHHAGRMNVNFKESKRQRSVSLCKRRPTLLKKAFELHSITGSDVFCLVQDKNGGRWFYGSGHLRNEFCSSGLKSIEQDQEYSVSKNPDHSIIVKPSPSKPHPTQTYLPSDSFHTSQFSQDNRSRITAKVTFSAKEEKTTF